MTCGLVYKLKLADEDEDDDYDMYEYVGDLYVNAEESINYRLIFKKYQINIYK